MDGLTFTSELVRSLSMAYSSRRDAILFRKVLNRKLHDYANKTQGNRNPICKRLENFLSTSRAFTSRHC